jgi:molecular chaperone GrpE
MSTEQTHSAIADAALESVTAEAQSKPRAGGGSPAERRISELEQQLAEANERALRSHAELENFRKRSQRELADERRYAVVPLVRDLLPVVDNLERAIEATEARTGNGGSAAAKAGDVASLLAGVKLVATQLETVLKQHQCARIETVGSAFDPNQHQAIAQEPSHEHSAGVVTRAAQAGYKLHDRVIRPAQVFVSTGQADNQSTK